MLRIAPKSVTLEDFNSDMIGKFAALSYCWGSASELETNPPLRLTSSTSRTLRAGMQVQHLPLTISQAAKLCNSLRIRYLWVDALCIMQDNRQDWEMEAKKMATIYSKAIITIIAASSTSCHSGFMEFDAHLGGHELDSPLSYTTGKLISRPRNYSGFHNDSNSSTSGQDPIDRRGWTLQEEVLSTRYVKFTRKDIQWECRGSTQCMCRQRYSPKSRPAFWSSKQESTRGGHGEFQLDWDVVMKRFNTRSFSIDTDKLLALSGLARRKAQKLTIDNAIYGSCYVGGLWISTTKADIGQLLWLRTIGTGFGDYYKDYVAPSFSWTSISAPVTPCKEYHDHLSWTSMRPQHCKEVYDWQAVGYLGEGSPMHLCHILDVRADPVSAGDIFGMVSNGFLVVRTPVVPCVVRGYSSGPWVTFKAAIASNLPSFMVFGTGGDCASFDCPVSLVRRNNGEATVRRSEHMIPFEDTACSIAIISQYDRGSTSQRSDPVWVGLLLGREIQGDGYQRLGIVYFESHPRPTEKVDLSVWTETITIY